MSNRSNGLVKNDGKRYTDIMLYCLVLGDAIRKTFLVTISEEMKVSELRKDIWDEIKYGLGGNVNARDLVLWKVKISAETMSLDTEINANNIQEELGGEELNPFNKASAYFNEPDHLLEEVPAKYIINIIIQPPPPATTDAPKKGISRLGGLGGTNMEQTEDGLNYEGVNLAFETVCQRESTISKLFQSLLEKRIILVRSPPMTGKTTLTQLLEHRLLQSDEVKKGLSCVFRISLLWMEDLEPNSQWEFTDQFKKLMNMNWSEFIDRCKRSKMKVFLIVDEVQRIYKPANENDPRHGGKVFWDIFKHVSQYLSNLYIVAFASYGHYGAYTTYENHTVMDISPCQLDTESTWGYENVRFTEVEFYEYFTKFCTKKLKRLKKEDIPFLYDYVKITTSLHPGLVVFTMDEIFKKFNHTSKLLTFGKVFAFLKSRVFHSHLKGIRASPKIDNMTDDEKRIVDAVLLKKRGHKLMTKKIPHNSRIIKTNVLVDISSISGLSTLDFPAPLFRALYLQDRLGSAERSISPPNSFKDFIALTFAKMHSKVLQKTKGRGVDGRLLERVWQMEFYRASALVLPEEIYASVDVGAVFRSRGYLDFYINDTRRWAIELLRDGINLKEHQQRFQNNGRYAPILEVAEEWAVVDIRNSKMGPPDRYGKDDIYALCDENFESIHLIYPDGTEQDVKLLGEECIENLLGIDISELLSYEGMEGMEID